MAITRHFVLSKSKPSTSEFPVEIDLTSWVGTDTIASVAYSAVDKADGSDVSSTVIDAAQCANTTLMIYPFIQAGTDKAIYVVTCVVTTTAGSIESFYLEFGINDDIPGISDLTIDATAGGSSSTSYCTLVEAETYHREKLHTENWDGASNDEKQSALLWARRLLDENAQWVGAIASSSQALRWPRSGVYDRDSLYLSSTEIPDFLRDAQAEFAAWLIGADRTAEPSTFGFKEIGLGRKEIDLVVDKYNERPLVPSIVWRMIRYYVRGNNRFLVKV